MHHDDWCSIPLCTVPDTVPSWSIELAFTTKLIIITIRKSWSSIVAGVRFCGPRHVSKQTNTQWLAAHTRLEMEITPFTSRPWTARQNRLWHWFLSIFEFVQCWVEIGRETKTTNPNAHHNHHHYHPVNARWISTETLSDSYHGNNGQLLPAQFFFLRSSQP